MQALLMREEAAVWTDQDDKEIEYGKWNVYSAKTTLAEENKVRPPAAADEIWPHWNDGVPTKLRRKLGSDVFFLGKVRHDRHEYYETVEIKWNGAHSLSS